MRALSMLCGLTLLAAVSCESSSKAMTRTELYFGRNSPSGEVTDAQWQQYVDEVITPTFPDGISVIDVQGQWKNAAGVRVRERSKLLIVLSPRTKEVDAGVERIRAEYKRRFAQESVLEVRSETRVKF